MKKKIIIVGIILIIILSLLIIFKDRLFKFSKEEVIITKNISEVDCLSINKKCSYEDIKKGILVKYQVSDNEEREFYVIGNSFKDITLISKDNIVEKTDWSSSFINKRGPVLAYEKLKEKTDSWNNVNLIKNFKYDDDGFKNYQDICYGDKDELISKITDEKAKENYKKIIDSYDCNRLNGAGYSTLYIMDGNLTIMSALSEKYNLNGIRARLPYSSEILKYYNDKENSWLNNLSSFWTMTSSTDASTGYYLKAWAFIKNNHKLSMEAIDTKMSNYNIGLNAVITIDKK